MVDSLEEGFRRSFLDYHIRHVLWNEVMHMLTPDFIDLLFGQLTVLVLSDILSRRWRLLNINVCENFLAVLLGHQLFSVLGLVLRLNVARSQICDLFSSVSSHVFRLLPIALSFHLLN